MKILNKNNIMIALVAGIFVIFLRAIPLFVTISKLVEQILPLTAYLIIPILWVKTKGFAKDSIGLVSAIPRLKEAIIAVTIGIVLAIMPLIVHQMGDKLPIIVTPRVLIILVVAVLVQAPLAELFWRGFIQKRLEDTLQAKWLSIIIVSILATLAWIPACLHFGGETMAIPANVLQHALFGLLYFKTRKLSVSILAHSTFNIGVILAHSYDILNVSAFFFGPPL